MSLWISIICAEVSVGRGWGGDEECCDVLGVSGRCCCCAGRGPRVLQWWLLAIGLYLKSRERRRQNSARGLLGMLLFIGTAPVVVLSERHCVWALGFHVALSGRRGKL
jgi:hypothetical protein